MPFRDLRALVILACAAWLTPGCALSDSPIDHGRDSDAAPSPRDAGMIASDAGAAGDAAAPSLADEYDPSDGAFEARASCFNGVDDNGDGAGDCDDRSCRENVPACCVGVSDPVCCRPRAPLVIPFDGCEGDVSACASITAIAEPFGSPRPRVESGDAPYFVAGGPTGDSGLLLRDAIDARTDAITLEASIAATTGRATGSDFLALGLVDAASASELTRVTPAVALMVSGNRGEVSLSLAGEIVRRWPLADIGYHAYALTVRPDGAIELSRDGERLGAAHLLLDRPLRAVLYGRSANPGPSDPRPARVRTLELTSSACDVPAALRAGDAPILPPPGASGWERVQHVGAPSVARWVDGSGASQERMAVAIDGAIFLARRGADGWALTSALEAPALRAPEGAIGDPALRWDGGALELWFAIEDGSVAKVSSVDERFAWEDVERTFVGTASTRYADPAPFLHQGRLFVAMRVDEGGRSRIALFLEDGSHVADVREQGTDLFAFDRDEIGSPAVVITGDDVLRMYFAGRRGSRFGIGVLVSPDGMHWREPSGGVRVLDASGAGFDALGVRDPEPVLDGDTLRLFYTGLDGTHARVGVATGPAPPPR